MKDCTPLPAMETSEEENSLKLLIYLYQLFVKMLKCL